ncbi:MAG: lytic transglycosylase domain-containing protein [Clostridia bacterium]
MKIDLRFLPSSTYSNVTGTTGVGSDLSAFGTGFGDLSTEQMFNELLDTELAKYQRVISAEQVLAELDGDPSFSDDAINGFASGQSAGTVPQRSDIMAAIKRIAKKYNVDDKLVEEVVRAESNFNPNAVSRVGAKGLMQLMDPTARSLQVNDSFDPVQNITGGTKYLNKLLTKYDGNVKVALAAYNAGPGKMDRLGITTDQQFDARMNELPTETQRYVAKITGRLDVQR